MIRVLSQPNPFSPGCRELADVPARRGLALGDLAPPWWQPDGRCFATIDGLPAAPDAPVRDGAYVHFVGRPGFPVPAIFGTGILAHIIAFVGNVAIAFFAGQIIQSLFGPKPPKLLEPGNTGSPAESFFSIPRARRAVGQPVPVVYGRRRVGGLVIAEYVQDDGKVYKIAQALSEGPVRAIGEFLTDKDKSDLEIAGAPGMTKLGLHINGQPGANLDTPLCSIRLGNLEQASLPGFEDTVTTSVVDTTLLEDPNYLLLPSAPGTYVTPPTWTSKVGFDMASSDQADRFRVRIGWLNGLFTTDAVTGEVEPIDSNLQIRYVRLSGGSPTGKYVVLGAHKQKADIIAPFYKDFEHAFFDPASYIAPAQGKALSLGGGSERATYTPDLGPSGPMTAGITVAGWVKFTHTDPDDDHMSGWIIHKLNTVSGRGFAWKHEYDTPTPAPPVERFILTIGINTGTKVFQTDDLPQGFLFEAGWRHVAASYIPDDGTGKARARFYIDGLVFHEILESGVAAGVHAVTQDLVVGGAPGDNGFEGSIDELHWYERELLEEEVFSLANQIDAYKNKVGYGSGQEVGIVAGWHFDDAVSPTADFVGSADLTLSGGATFDTDGQIFVPESGPILRGTYHVEVVRTDKAGSAAAGEFISPAEEDQPTWVTIDTILDEDFEHPGTAVIGLEFFDPDASGSSPPDVTVMVDGRLVPVWDGVSVEVPNVLPEWSRNPAWIYLDLLTNAEYGLGDVYDFAHVDLPELLAWADYCDELIDDGRSSAALTGASYAAGTVTIEMATGSLKDHWIGPKANDGGYHVVISGTSTDWDTDAGLGIEIVSVDDDGTDATITGTWPTGQAAPVDPAPSTGTVQGVDVRFRCDFVFDRANISAWEAAQLICRTGRAVPVRAGNAATVFWDRPRDPVDKIGMGAIHTEPDFAGTKTGPRTQPNSIDLEFFDEADDYEPAFATIDSPNLQDPAKAENFRKDRIRLDGVTRRLQVMRYGKYLLNSYELLRDACAGSTATQAIAWRPGDVVLVSHDVPVGWGSSGRCRAISGPLDRIIVDRTIVFESGKTYDVQVVHAQTGLIETKAVHASEIPGTANPGDEVLLASALTQAAADDDQYSVGETGVSAKPMAMLSLELEAQSMRTKFRAVEYDADVYDDDPGDILDAGVQLQSLAPKSAGKSPRHVRNLELRTEVHTERDGTAAPSVVASWRPAPEDGVAIGSYAVWVARASAGERFEVEFSEVGAVGADHARYRIGAQHLIPGAVALVKVQPISADGVRRPLGRCRAAEVTNAVCGMMPPELESATITLGGDDAVYRYVPAAQDVGSVGEVVGKIGGWLFGQTVFTREWLVGFNFGPTQNWGPAVANAVDSIGACPHRFRTRLPSGLTSIETIVELSRSPLGSTSLADDAFEDNWAAGTHNGTAADSGYSPPALRFASGSAETATWVSPVVTVGSLAERVDVHVWAEAYQVVPTTIGDLDFRADSYEAQRWTPEGPTVLAPGEERGRFSIQWRYDTDTDPSNAPWEEFRHGRVYLRSFQVRLSLVRPGASYDVVVNRAVYRIYRPAPHEASDGDGGVWS